MFVSNFCTPGSGSGSGLRIQIRIRSRDPIESGSNLDPDTDPGPDPQHCLYMRSSFFISYAYVATLAGLEPAIPRLYSYAYKKKKGSRRAGVICMQSCVLYEARTLQLIPI